MQQDFLVKAGIPNLYWEQLLCYYQGKEELYGGFNIGLIYSNKNGLFNLFTHPVSEIKRRYSETAAVTSG
jgi:hypothetical protein